MPTKTVPKYITSILEDYTHVHTATINTNCVIGEGEVAIPKNTPIGEEIKHGMNALHETLVQAIKDAEMPVYIDTETPGEIRLTQVFLLLPPSVAQELISTLETSSVKDTHIQVPTSEPIQ